MLHTTLLPVFIKQLFSIFWWEITSLYANIMMCKVFVTTCLCIMNFNCIKACTRLNNKRCMICLDQAFIHVLDAIKSLCPASFFQMLEKKKVVTMWNWNTRYYQILLEGRTELKVQLFHRTLCWCCAPWDLCRQLCWEPVQVGGGNLWLHQAEGK